MKLPTSRQTEPPGHEAQERGVIRRKQQQARADIVTGVPIKGWKIISAASKEDPARIGINTSCLLQAYYFFIPTSFSTNVSSAR
jgi:hypothetical protein